MRYTSASLFMLLTMGFLVSHSAAVVLRGNEEKNETVTLDGGRETLGEGPSLEYDLEVVAKTFDWSVEDTKMHMALQDSFSSFIEILEKDENFADSEMPMNPGDCATIYFKRHLPKWVKRRIEAFEKENHVEVRTLATKFSQTEQEERAEKISEMLSNLGFTSVGYSLGPGDALVVNAVPPEGSDYQDTPNPEIDEVDLDVIDEVAQKILKNMCDGGGNNHSTMEPPVVKSAASITASKHTDIDKCPYGLRLILSSEDEGEAEFHTRGGRQIRSAVSQCTTGFSVIRSNGQTTGIATAAHCTGMNMYDAEPPTFDYATVWQGQHNGAWGDFEWHTTGHIKPPEYWASPTERRFVNAIDTSFSKNDVVCGYSRERGIRFCDRIYRTSVKQGSTKRLVAMRNRNMRAGDSGGPWSVGTTACGLVKGAKRIWFKWRDTWSRASYISIGLPGVIVRTT